MLGKLRGALDPDAAPQLPDGFQAQLRVYQLEGYQWMRRLATAGLGACLADDMGLGKTVQTLALLLARPRKGLRWWWPPPASVPTGSRKRRSSRHSCGAALRRRRRGAALQAAGPMDVFLCSYGLLPMEAERLQRVPWPPWCWTKARTSRTPSPSAVRRSWICSRVPAVLSGTPVENHLAELWNLFRFLNPGLLGSMDQFRKRFQEPIEREQDSVALGRLRRMVAPFLLRRTKGQVLKELPPRTEIVLELEPASEATFLEACGARAWSPGRRPRPDLQVLAALMRLRRACCNPALVQPELNLPSTKLEAFLTWWTSCGKATTGPWCSASSWTTWPCCARPWTPAG